MTSANPVVQPGGNTQETSSDILYYPIGNHLPQNFLAFNKPNRGRE